MKQELIGRISNLIAQEQAARQLLIAMCKEHGENCAPDSIDSAMRTQEITIAGLLEDIIGAIKEA